MALSFVDILKSLNHTYNNVTSGLTADNTQEAVDELAVKSVSKVDTNAQSMVSSLDLPDATLSAIDNIVNANTVVDVKIYRTKDDDDGGTWVDKATTQS